MHCEACHGKGFIQHPIPCPECNGFAIQHCCDGLREQPEIDPTEQSYSHWGIISREAPGHPLHNAGA